MKFREIKSEGMDWIHLVAGRNESVFGTCGFDNKLSGSIKC
jgi:hypothetical protein